jgi:hypothetical protein
MKKGSLHMVLGAFGIILTLNALLFRFMGMPDMWRGLYSGPVLLLLAVIVYMMKIRPKPASGLERLSSRVTFMYKYIIPVVLGIGVALYFIFLDRFTNQMEFFVPLGYFILFMWVVLTTIGVTIRDVWFSDSAIEVFGYKDNYTFSLQEVKTVERFLFNFYRIRMKDGRRIVFISHILELAQNFAQDPMSIRKLRALLKETKGLAEQKNE